MRNWPKILTASFCICGLTGCATINKGTSDFFRIDSVPQGAVATTSIETSSSRAARRKNPTLAPQYHGCAPTPCAVKVSRRENFVIKLEQPGYETAQMFITHSKRSGSFTANMMQTGAVVSGSAAAGAAAGAAAATTFSALANTLAAASAAGGATLGTFGLIPIETSFAVANSVFVPTSYSASSAAAAAIPPALAITGGSLLLDAVSGANQNIFPNPVVLEMAPKGAPTKIDPNVAPFLESLKVKDELFENCVNSRSPSHDRLRRCRHEVQSKGLPHQVKIRRDYLKSLKQKAATQKAVKGNDADKAK